MYKVCMYTGTQKPGNFYIQAKGLHSGRPLKQPIRNCFAVYTDDDMLYEKAYSLYIGRYYEQHIKGSVVPFIRKKDVEEVLDLSLQQKACSKTLHAIRNIDNLVANLKTQINYYKQLQHALCRKINSKGA